MKFFEVKSLFLVEFGRYALDNYEMRNTWLSFVGELFDAGMINNRVYNKCCAIA